MDGREDSRLDQTQLAVPRAELGKGPLEGLILRIFGTWSVLGAAWCFWGGILITFTLLF
jgi:hypothetical protein